MRIFYIAKILVRIFCIAKIVTFFLQIISVYVVLSFKILTNDNVNFEQPAPEAQVVPCVLLHASTGEFFFKV